jgi:hypothetical protein
LPERVAFTKRSLRRGMSRSHEHLSRDAREDIPVQLGNCAHDGGTPSRVSLLQRLRVRRPSREEQEGDQRTQPRRGPRGPFAGEGRASWGSGDAMQMTAREGVASRGGSPPTLSGRGRSTPFWLRKAARSEGCRRSGYPLHRLVLEGRLLRMHRGASGAIIAG